jgi:hypothetical protein
MYYPYFRGKQYELILLRELSSYLVGKDILPIIEPVRGDFSALSKTLDILNDNGVSICIILNPWVGQMKDDPEIVRQKLDEQGLLENSTIEFGYLLAPGSDVERLVELIREYPTKKFSIIHQGFTEGKELATAIEPMENIKAHVFLDGFGGKRYQRLFKKDGVRRILVRDGFKQKKNADYARNEHFSELHITYEDEGMDGFGDYLIVGEEYTESGGPAYAIAIHLTYIDPDEDEDMFIYHFISDQKDSPTDPGGKFLEALRKLIRTIDRPRTKVFNSSACEEFRMLNYKQHYPGLGHVKKLSMKHHIELVMDFLERT